MLIKVQQKKMTNHGNDNLPSHDTIRSYLAEPMAKLLADQAKICMCSNFCNKLPSCKPPPCICMPVRKQPFLGVFHTHGHRFCKVCKVHNESDKEDCVFKKASYLLQNFRLILQSCPKDVQTIQFFNRKNDR